MIVLLKLAFFTVITVLAWRIAVSEDMIFEKIGKWAEKKVDEGHKIFELLICVWCMGSIWSIVGWSLAYLTGVVKASEFNDWRIIFFYPCCVFISSIVCGFTWTIYLTINQIKDKNEIEAKYLESKEANEFFDLKDRKKKFNGNK